MKGLFIPGITAEMFRSGCLESIETLMAEGKIFDIEYDMVWTPISEDLPKEEKPIILCTDSGHVVEGLYYGKHGKQMHDIWKIYEFDEPYLDDEIVAWMPLPRPYKGENK